MLTRVQEFHDYIFSDRADVDASIKNVPEKHKPAQKARKLEKIKEFFFDEKKPIIYKYGDSRAKFRVALRHLRAKSLETVLFGNTTDPLDKKSYTFPADFEIEAKFQQFEKEHHLFAATEQNAALEKFTLFYKICRLIDYFVETTSNSETNNTISYLHAYKMLVIFGDQDDPKKYFHTLDEYIKRHNCQQMRKPVHDILVWALPHNKPPKKNINLAQWRKIMHASGGRALKIFSRALEIENALKKAPETFKEAQACAELTMYKKAKLDPELAEVCLAYDLTEDTFNRCLKITESRKKSDNLPHLIIDGKDIDKPDYFLTKLPIEDPRAFILGHITNCCQSIGGHSESCVVDGVTLPNNGFYVLLKRKKLVKTQQEEKEVKHENDIFKKSENGLLKIDYTKFDIVGQGYAWLSTRGNLTFDSWENLHPAADNPIIVRLLELFGKAVTERKDSSVTRVTIGSGGKTPDEFKVRAPFPEKQLDGEQYGDSSRQQLVSENKEMLQAALANVRLEMEKIQQLEKKSEIGLITQVVKFSEIKSICEARNVIELLKKPKFIAYFTQPDKRATLLKILKYENLYQKLNVTYSPSINKLMAIQDKKGEFHGINKTIVQALSVYVKNKEILLLNAVKQSNLHAFRALIEEKANPNAVANVWGGTGLALCLAVVGWGDEAMTTALLEAKADVNVRDNRGKTPLFYTSSIDTARTLMKAGADIKIASKIGYTVLHCYEGDDVEFVRYLLKMRANPNATNDHGSTPLHILAGHSTKEIIELLLSHGAKVNVANKSLETPLLIAVRNKKMNIARLLLQAKADANAAENCSKHSVLHHAINDLKDVGFVKELLAAKANPHVVNNYKENMLNCAVRHSLEMTKLFLDEKVNIELANKWDLDKPLHIVARRLDYEDDSYETLVAMLAAQAQVNVINNREQTPLHFAAANKNAFGVKALLEAKADVGAVDYNKQTALHFAARYGCLHHFKTLLAAGVNPLIQDKVGLTAIQHLEKQADQAQLQFNIIAVDDIAWLQKQVKKISEQKEKDVTIKIAGVLQKIDDLSEEKNSSEIRFLNMVEFLIDTISKPIKHYEALPEATKKSLLTQNPYNSFYCAAIYALLQKVNSDFTQIPFVLVQNKFKPLGKDLFDSTAKLSLSAV